MVYLRRFCIPSLAARELFVHDIRKTCYSTVYPFNVFARTELPALTFEPITILYGGNGSGKSTLLNIMAEKVGIAHRTVYNRSNFFEEYLTRCDYEAHGARTALQNGRIITSDDVFDYLLNIRCLNEKLDTRRDVLLDEYDGIRNSGYSFRGMQDYDKLKAFVEVNRRSTSKSSYVRGRMMGNVPEKSNGESALSFFTQTIQENALYLLDEPENSLSAERQQELVRFLTDSARFYGCQFIMATHSPFLLAMPDAKVYDLDEEPPRVKKWTQLKNVRVYYRFFMSHRDELEDS